MSKKISNKKIQKNKNQIQKYSARAAPLMPMPFRAASLRSMHIRTIANAPFNATILLTDLSALLGVTARTATSSFYLSSLFRVVKIEVWAPVAVAGTSVTASLQWINSNLDFETPPITLSDSSVSFDRPAHVQAHPPRNSLNSKWHGSSVGDNFCALSCPSGSTVDFIFDWVLEDTFAGTPTNGPVLVAAIPGVVYHHPIQVILIPQSVRQL